jgi:Leucine-rich repeat (LRR) protein
MGVDFVTSASYFRLRRMKGHVLPDAAATMPHMRPCLVLIGALAFAVRASAAIPVSERDALVAIYNATGGANWTDKTNWLAAAGTECTWYGVYCDEAQSNVVGIGLGDNNLRGTFPPDIAKLTKLRNLQLWYNHLSGPLPQEIGQLTDLEIIYAGHNEFSGRIPASFGALKKLEELALDDNRLAGPLPAEIGDMLALRSLGLSYNAIDGAIPAALWKLTNLTFLDLTNNQLTGNLSSEIGKLTKLDSFSAAVNQLSGEIPPQLGDLPALTYLNLTWNKLEGRIPAELGRLQALEELYLYQNQFSGPIPAALGDLSSLRILHLYANKLTGSIPPELYRLAALEELDLGDNQLTGGLSADVQKLVKLQVLWLNDNKLDGTIPAAVTTIPTLRVFATPRNAMAGPIPPEFGRLTNLERIDVSSNKHTGQIPRELGGLSKLDTLLLATNQLEGTIPPEIGQLTNLVYFHVGNNRLTGTIPDTLRNLTKLQQIGAGSNRLTGSVPTWISELRELTDIFIGDNQFTGTIPASIATMDKLAFLDLGQNFLTGPLPDLARLGELRYLSLAYNQLTGSIPTSIGALTKITDLALNDNALTGVLPREIGNLTNAEYLSLSNNVFQGPIPAEIGQLKKVYSLSLHANRLSGAIPPQIGDMSGLQYLGLSFNALRGPIPAEITKLTKLVNEGSDFSYNGLFTSDANVRAFVNSKQYAGNFESTQTVTPSNFRVTATTDRSATVTWTPFLTLYAPGGYQVAASKTPGGAPVSIATTSWLDADTIVVRNLDPSTSYFFTVSTVTHPFDVQQNLLVSDASAPVQASTGPRVVAPAEVAVTEAPAGIVQIDGVDVVSDSFTLTNFGDVPTNIEVDLSGEFFSVSPAAFPLAAGASRVVEIKTTPQQPGTYYGNVIPRGTGVANGTYADVVLLSAKRPVGTVIAVPVSPRVEVGDVPGSDSIGVVQFRNNGTATLSGILVSDQPWVQPDRKPIIIAPNSIGSINFRVLRSKRPTGIAGVLTANLTLVYVAGSIMTLGKTALDVAPVNVSKVTVVDTTKPPVAPGSAPALLPGEVAFFAPGVSAAQRLGGTLGSDISIFNFSAARSISDLRLYFTAAGASQSNVATIPSVASAQAVNLVNVVNNVYGASNAAGSLQIRSASDWRNLAVAAKLTNVRGEGTFTGDVPVFRSDRAATSAQPVILTGLRKPSDIYVQEMGGVAANTRVEFFDANGSAAGTPLTPSIASYGFLELRDAVPAGAVTAIVTVEGSARIGAYARVADESSGDTWSVADWSRVNKYALNEAVRVVVASGSGGGSTVPGTPGRRRAVPHSIEPAADEPRGVTDVTFYNPGTAEARAKLQVRDTSGGVSEREVIVGAKKTITVSDAAAPASTAFAQLVVDPTRGSVVVTARSYRSSARTFGSAIPVVAASSGLRVGQTQTFADLHDSTAATVAAATPATFRTGYGFVETAGETATVRVSVTIVETRGPIAARSTVTREFELGARQQIVLDDLVRSIAGAARETEFGDLHGLQLQVEVIRGGGAVVPFVIVTDNGSGDSLVRLE